MERAVDFRRAVKEFGGFTQLADKLGVPLSTCHGWSRRRKLPQWREMAIVALAKAEGKDVFKRKRKKGRHKVS